MFRSSENRLEKTVKLIFLIDEFVFINMLLNLIILPIAYIQGAPKKM